jgi:positive regulator of sigma E activity
LVFACVFGAALIGMLLRYVLPEHHFSADTKDTVKLAMGLVATMAALILGLLVASAKSAYDTESSGVTQMAAKIVFLDRMLANYGPETKEAREVFRRTVARMAERMWPEKPAEHSQLDPSASRGEAMYAAIEKLTPKSELQTSLKDHALTTALELSQMRWLEFEEADSSISAPMLYILTLWLAILFVSFGLFSPSNGTVVAALMLAALSVAGAIFLILELNTPFNGMMQISDAPFLNALAYLGQ